MPTCLKWGAIPPRGAMLGYWPHASRGEKENMRGGRFCPHVVPLILAKTEMYMKRLRPLVPTTGLKSFVDLVGGYF